MSRNTGTFNFAANFEGLLKAPIDARQLVETLADLTGATTWNASGNVWLYDGAIVSVSNDPDPLNNGIYFLDDADNYDNINSWVKAGEGGSGTITGGTNGLSTDGANIVLGGELLSGTTITITSGTTLTIEDLRGTPLGIQYAANYDSGFTPRSLVDKEYVDSVATGLDPKLAVEVATSPADGNIDLTGTTFTSGSTIDGIVIQDGWRVLIKNQTSEQFNGIWVFSGSSDTFYRSEDFDEDSEVIQGALIPVITGNTNKNTLWVLVTPNPIILDTTPLEFSLFSSPIVTAGLGIDISGVTISVDGSVLAGNGIIWSGDTFNVDTSIIDYPITGATNGLDVVGKDVVLGGTLTGNTLIDGNFAGDLEFVNINKLTFRFDDSEISDQSGLNRGLLYGADYTTGFTNNSLVSKLYVDLAISGATSGITGTITGATNGLSVYGEDIGLGGTLTTGTTINGDGNNITFTDFDTVDFNTSNQLSLESTYITMEFQTSLITDINPNPAGLQYAACYHDDYTNRSLIDKEYVNNQITGASLTFDNGLTKSGQVVSLGGTLTGDTVINTSGNYYQFSIEAPNSASACFSILGADSSTSEICLRATNSSIYIGDSLLDLYSGDNNISITPDIMTITDGGDGEGIKYVADYSSGFVARSLVDKGYVTGYTQSAITTNSNVINIADFTGTGYTATTESDFIGASGGTTIYLPNPPKNGQRIIVADIEGNAVSENIIIDGNGNNIEGVSTATINTDYGSITFIFNTKGFWSTTAFIN